MAIAHPMTGHDTKNCPDCIAAERAAEAAIRHLFRSKELYESLWKL